MPPPGPDYVLNGAVTLSGTAQASVNVKVQNNRTGESITVTTNASGNYLAHLGNLPSGWAIGDLITSSAIYTAYEASGSITIIVAGTSTINLALTAVSVGDLNYCTIQDVTDYLGIDITVDNPDITSEQIRKIGLRVEDMIERRGNTIFHDNNGSYTTVTTEYHDARRYQRYFFLKKRPVISFTKLEVNTADDTNATGTWVDVTSDCKTDSETGRVDLIATGVYGPTAGTKMFRATYTYGFATTPEDIKQLTVLMIVRELLRSSVTKALIEGKDNFRPTETDILNEQIDNIFKRWTYPTLVNV